MHSQLYVGPLIVCRNLESKIDSFFIGDKTNETFTLAKRNEEKDIFILNKKPKLIGRQFVFYPEDGDFFQDLYYNLNQYDEISNMSGEFSKEIRIIVSLYGKENVTLSWGMVNQIL